AGGLAALAVWQAGSPKVAGVFVVASVVALALLAAVARGVMALARRLPRLPSLAWRHGLPGLHRPGGQTAGIVVALGVGGVVVAVALLERSLSAQIDLERKREAPTFFFVDIQPDQADGFARALGQAAGGGPPPELTPVVRSRLIAINGQPVRRERAEGGREDAGRDSP